MNRSRAISSDVTMMGGQVDEPVTSDIKRLIRMAGSLHGKTSLRVTEMDRDELDGFDPLRDAVPPTFGDEPVSVVAREAIDVELGGERFTLEGESEVPLYAAIFLLCRGEAILVDV